MTDRASDMRGLVDIITEASVGDLLRKAGDGMAARLGEPTAVGRAEKRHLARKMHAEYRKYLGRTNSDLDEKSLAHFLTAHLGFTEQNAKSLMSKVGIDPTAQNEAILTELSSEQVDKLFTTAAEFAFAHNLVGSGSKTGVSGRAPSTSRDSTSVPGAASKQSDQSQTAGLDRHAMLRVAKQSGLRTIEIKEINEIVDKLASWEDLEKQPDAKQLMAGLAKVGFAFLKANGK